MEIRVGGKYRLGYKIRSGSFGEVYLGINVRTNEEVAIKLEPVKARQPQLLYEAKIYRILAGTYGIPVIYWSGVEGDFNCMVLELMGPSLEDLFHFAGRKFSLKTALMLSDQIISRIEALHNRNLIHRDIKPDNFVIGLESPNGTRSKSRMVHMIDFGLAKRYRDMKSNLHIPYREDKSLTGTARYASLNTHMGIEQSRRDDLEAVGYMLIYFTQGSLPWQGLKAKGRKEKHDLIREKKMSLSVEELCKDAPSDFAAFISHCRSIRFEDAPGYSYLRKLLKGLLFRQGFLFDFCFDWTPIDDWNPKEHGSEDRKSVEDGTQNNDKKTASHMAI